MKKFLLASFVVLAASVVLIVFIPSLFEAQIASALRREINNNIHAEVSFSQADLSLWHNFPRLTASLDNFSISGNGEFEGDTLLRTDKLSLVISTARLFFDDAIEIRHLSLHKPEILVIVSHHGSPNYDIALHNTADSSGSVSLDIESWEIENGQVVYQDDENGFHIETGNITLNGAINIHGAVTELSVAGVADGLGVAHNNKDVMRNKTISLVLEGTYDSRKRFLKFSENSLSINDLDLSLSGSLDFRGDDLGVDLKVKSGESDFSDILSLNQAVLRDFEKMKIQGRMSLEAEFLGVYNDEKDKIPAFKANLIVSDGSVKYNSLSSSLNQINFDLAAFNTDGRLANTVIALQYFGMNVGENPVFGSAEIKGFNDGHIAADMLANLPLEDLANVYPMEGIDLGGELSLEVKANGPYTGKFWELLSAEWTGKRVPAFRLGIKLENGTIAYGGLPETIKDVNLRVDADNSTGALDDTRIHVEELKALLGDSPIEGHWRMQGLENPFIDGALRAKVALEDVREFYPLDQVELKGAVDVDLKVDGKWSRELSLFPKINASLNVRDGFVKSDSYPAPLENAHLVLRAENESGRFADTRFVVDTLTFTIEEEPFVVSGSVHDLENYNYDLDLEGVLSLDKLQKIFGIRGVTMKGEVDVDMKAKGNLPDLRAGEYHRLPAEGHLKVNDVFLKGRGLGHGLQLTNGNLFFTNEKIILDTLHGSIGSSHFRLSGHLYNYFAYLLHTDEPVRGDLVFESAHLDINDLLREDHNDRDTVHHDLEAFSLPRNIDFTFDSRVEMVSYKNLSLTNFTGEVVMRDGILTLNETKFNSLDAAFILAGDYDPREPRRPRFDLSVGIHELNIDKAHEAFVAVQAIAPASEHTYGMFSVDYAIKGELTSSLFPVLASLEGAGTVRVRDAVVNGMKVFHHISGLTKKEELMNPKLKDIVMEIDVKKGTVNVKPFTMKLGGFDTEIVGKHELTGGLNYILKIALPPFDLVKIPLHVDGTYDNPRVRIGKGHEEDLRKAISHAGAQGDAGLY